MHHRNCWAGLNVASPERRLVAILAADIVGYSRMMEADEAATLAAIKTVWSETIDPLLVQHRGRVAKLMGDGAIVEFASVVDAVAFAVAMQQAVAAHEADAPPERRIVFRIGVNLGDVLVENGDLLGDGVNVAARLEQLCEPGGVLVSGTAYDHLQGKLGLPLDFTGDQQVKNISRPIPTYSVRMAGGKPATPLKTKAARRFPRGTVALLLVLAVAGLAAWWFAMQAAPRAKPSIAVIPFDNLSRDEATGRLAEGLTEDIITDLARFREFEVIARNSVETYKDKPVDIAEVQRTLNVRYVLEGSIQRQQDRVRVTGQLIDATAGTHVWSDRWDRPIADVFDVQAELSQTVAAKLSGIAGTIIAADREAARRKSPSDLDAYDLFVLATEDKQRETKDSIASCVTLLKQSLAIDPNFARAWTLLGSCYAISLRWTDNWDETNGQYQDAVRRAVELDPLDADAHAGLAFALGFAGDLRQSEVEFDKALSLNPNSADVLTRYAFWAAEFGKAEDGAAMAELAARLDPNAPPWALRMQSTALFAGGRAEDAIRIRKRVPREMFTDGDFIELAIYMAKLGRIDEAKSYAAEGLAAFPAISIESWTGDPGWSDAERRNTVALMRKAGFPPCASAEEFSKGGIKVRLPECN
jgi:TolB-like protein/class 3 adenylate cyclase/tetratricopeptide (TPR) repeat protein